MREKHPYGDYIPKGTTSLIIGSFPIGKFSNPDRKQEIKSNELDFYFGGERNLLWKLLSEVFVEDLSSKNKIQNFLKHHHLGIGDLIISCRRLNGGGSDSDLLDIEWNTKLLSKIRKSGIKTIYFTSKKVENWFNRLFPESQDLKKILLISPSAQSVRSIYHHPDYKAFMDKNPDARPFDFILNDYRQKFISNA